MKWLCNETKWLVRHLAIWASYPSSERADLVLITWHHVEEALQLHTQALTRNISGGSAPGWSALDLLREVTGREMGAVDTAAYLLFASGALLRAPDHADLAALVDRLGAKLKERYVTA